MNKFKHKIKQFCSSTKGFTLIELLVALALVSTLVAISSVGLVAILQANAKSDEDIDRGVSLNRALDFISDEVRRSKQIAADASTVTPTGFTEASTVEASTVQKVLALTIPGVTTPVVYYIASLKVNPTTGKPTSIWSGPKVIYRWGPTLNLDGTYSSAASSNELLVDFIDNSTPNPNPACSSPATNANPPTANRTGFYACVNSQGAIASIYLRGKLTKSSKSYQVNSTVFARSQ